jgi:polyisoprenoid-binding protein YceI
VISDREPMAGAAITFSQRFGIVLFCWCMKQIVIGGFIVNIYHYRTAMRSALVCLVAFAVLPSISRAQAPVFAVTKEASSVKFFVKASVALTGTFDKWDAALTFTSPDISTGVLSIKIQADSVNSGSGMKDGKLKSKDFFDAQEDPYITFVSTKIV